MDDIAIRVERLGKRYRIGTRQPRANTLFGRFKNLAASPLDYLWSTLRAPSADEILWALKDVSFEVKKGEVVGIIGRNGAGKSTLLKILARITEPTEGFAEINGRVGSLLEVGTGFHPQLTGRENIYLNGAILGMRKAEIDSKFEEIIDFAETKRFIDTPVKRYSSGMYVRLAFAVAAHLDPEIFLVDEVLAVGDAAFQKKCLGKMGEVAQEGRTVLFVSHNMAAILNLCRRGIVIESGRVTFAGGTEEAIERYLSSSSKHEYGFGNLSWHPGRSRGMQPIIQSVSLCSKDGVGVHRTSVRTGERVVFRIQYDCGDTSLDYAGIGICTSLGERIFTVGTHLCPDFEGSMLGQGTIECCIPHLALAEGEYSLTVWIGTRTPMRYVDCVSGALRFRVVGGDYFATGATLLRGQGYLAQRSMWRLGSVGHDVGVHLQQANHSLADMGKRDE